MRFTGERYTTDYQDCETAYEHWHRYLYASQFAAGKVVLDIACGEGYGSDWLARTAKQVIGVDVDPQKVRHASSKYLRPNLEFRQGPAEVVPVEGREVFDVVVCFETIEYLWAGQQKNCLREVGRLLKPDGVILVSTPNKLYYSDEHNYKDPFHRKEFYSAEYVNLLKQFFRTVYVLGQKVYPTSYIWQLAGPPRPGTEHQLARSDGQVRPVNGDKKEALYLIAVCSNGEIEVPGGSVLLDTSERATRGRRDKPAAAEGVRAAPRAAPPAPKYAAHLRAIAELRDAFERHVRGKAARDSAARQPAFAESERSAENLIGENGVAAPRMLGPKPSSLEVLGKAKLRSLLAARGSLVFPKVEDPVVTVVIPTFNKAHYTCATFQGLLAGAPELPFELVVVDNASTDETQVLLERLQNVRVRVNERNLGFGGACNLGAEMARGEYVCFLNSDTLPTPGWLSALVRTVRAYPQCGAVGGKLVHPDGKLQEAGSIIWRDGSTAGYGRGADPLVPEYCYVREADYCSAACLLVRKELFQYVGGFDDRYAPAYYEDADLCLSIRQAGYKVVYQPNAVVFHVEFGSSDARQGVDLQLRNRARFRDKWGDRLLEQSPPLPERLFAARDRREGRRILVVDDWIPVPGLGMGLPRARTMLNALVELGYVVTFMPTLDESSPEPATTELQQIGVEVLHSVTDHRAKIEERPHVYDAVIISRPGKTAIMEAVKRVNPTAPIIYDAEAIFALREIQQAEVEGRPLPPQEARSRLRSELAQTDLADVVMTVSDAERRLFQGHNPRLRVVVWGHALLERHVEADFSERQDLMFVGNLGTAPNVDAVLHLVRSIFPQVRSRLGCRLVLVGANPAAEILAAVSALPEPEAVQVTGFVDELAPVYDRCRVFVAPHRYAAGIPYKVHEAMANGIPCVISRLLAEQLDVTDGAEALVADGPQEFAEKAARLYQDPELWQRIQRQAFRLVKASCDPAAMRDRLGAYVEEAVARKRGKRAEPSKAGTRIEVGFGHAGAAGRTTSRELL
jgi:GT2 family glycosyltransferase/glycosyltransferase involved in cell wall biosynthesis/SAM-dependent methyltransferase